MIRALARIFFTPTPQYRSNIRCSVRSPLPVPRALRQEPQTDDLGVGENVEHMLQATVALRHLRSTREQPPLDRLSQTGEVDPTDGPIALRLAGPHSPGLVQAGLHRRRG